MKTRESIKKNYKKRMESRLVNWRNMLNQFQQQYMKTKHPELPKMIEKCKNEIQRIQNFLNE